MTVFINRHFVRVTVIVAAVAFFASSLSFSQVGGISFSHVDVNNGLSDNSVRCIFRDSRGFIWIGTSNGLNCFEGYKLEVYRKNSAPFMLPQKNPDYYTFTLRSFNIPEFVTGKVRTDGRSLLKTIGSPAKNVNFELKN